MKIAVKYFGVHLILPEQAKYLATDMDGDVWWYTDKPVPRLVAWLIEGRIQSANIGRVTTLRFQPTPLPWWDTMREVKDILLSKVS